MRVKTFRGDNAKAVLAQIKKELGPSAVILSNQSRRENGRNMFEIMAAVEEDLTKTTERPMKASVPGTPGPGFRAPGLGAASLRVAGIGSPEPSLPGLGTQGLLAQPPAEQPLEWAKEWAEIKKHLHAFLKPHMDLDSLSPNKKLALQYLERAGLEQGLILSLYQRLKANPNCSLLAELDKMAQVMPSDADCSQRLQLVIGPHGVGKTTSLLRMALACKRSGKHQRICLVNADSRGNARKQLKHYAELSGLSYMEADGPEEFALLLAQCRNFDKIFVDLPGLSRDETFKGWLKERGLADYEKMAAHLVLSPMYSQEQFKAFWQRYQAPCLKSLIWTKLDEACSYGSLINVAAMTELPASTLSYGPGITNSMAAAESKVLWKLIFTRQLPVGQRAAVELAA